MSYRILGITLLAAAASAPAAPAASAPARVQRALGAVIVQDEGRTKPLDTYARSLLLQFGGKSTWSGQPAPAWLARALFTPDQARNDKVFRVRNPDVAYALGIEPDPKGWYSFAALAPSFSKLSGLAQAAMAKEEANRSAAEAEALRLYANLGAYQGLSEGLRVALPDTAFRVDDPGLASALGVPGGTCLSYLGTWAALSARAAPRDPAGKAMGPGNPFARLVRAWMDWGRGHGDQPLAIFPAFGHGQERWLGPWEALSQGGGDTAVRAALANLSAAAAAYGRGDWDACARALEGYNGYVARAAMAGGAGRTLAKARWELAYNRLDPFYHALWFYGGALLCLLFSALGRPRPLRLACALLLAGGLLPHIAGIGLRMAITGRPPITNLYETFLFVGCAGGILGLVLEALQRKGLGLLVGSATAFAVTLLSLKYGSDGDSMKVLVAVLDSNFWLTTHVITISLGYAGCCVAGVLGHAYLVRLRFRPGDRTALEGMHKALMGLLGFGLLFSFVGTVLGGIWADQSWGRFWGWDPKENGALLIVLWCAILLHAKPARILGEKGIAAGAVLGTVVVMLAWFGVNLLGVGLHSYGFTSGAARTLGTYIGAELAFLALVFAPWGPGGRAMAPRAIP